MSRIQHDILAHKLRNEQAIRDYTEEMLKDTFAYCGSHGGHFMTNWRVVAYSPIFQVPGMEERVCTACGYTETRVPTYTSLNTGSHSVGLTYDVECFSSESIIKTELDDDDD